MDKIHFCYPWRIQEFYRNRPEDGFRYRYRLVCRDCGKTWNLKFYPARDLIPSGKLVGYWFTSKDEIPGRKERREWRNTFCVPWNYFDEDYEVDQKQDYLLAQSLERSEKKTEAEVSWKEFQKDGGMSSWP